MTLGSISRRAWMAALVAVVAASVALSATAVAGAGKEKPEVTAITVRPIHEAQVVRGDDGHKCRHPRAPRDRSQGHGSLLRGWALMCSLALRRTGCSGDALRALPAAGYHPAS